MKEYCKAFIFQTVRVFNAPCLLPKKDRRNHTKQNRITTTHKTTTIKTLKTTINIAILSVILLIFSCTEEVQQVDHAPPEASTSTMSDTESNWDFNTTPMTEAAYAKLQSILEVGDEVTGLAEFFHVNGDFAHLTLKAGKPATIPQKLSILSNGEVVSVNEADALFTSKHREDWGALSYDAAKELKDENSETRLSFVVRTICERHEEALNKLREIDPELDHASADNTFCIANISATKDQILSIIYEEYLISIMFGANIGSSNQTKLQKIY